MPRPARDMRDNHSGTRKLVVTMPKELSKTVHGLRQQYPRELDNFAHAARTMVRAANSTPLSDSALIEAMNRDGYREGAARKEIIVDQHLYTIIQEFHDSNPIEIDSYAKAFRVLVLIGASFPPDVLLKHTSATPDLGGDDGRT